MTNPEREKLQALIDLVRASSRIVFFGGAGVSTESGIPDFRSRDGLYQMKWQDPPERILSASYFREHTEEFYRFYREKVFHPEAKPNVTHYKLAEWERAGKLLAVITQNIDGLHQAAGSERVFELHGSVHRNFCMACRTPYGVRELLAAREAASDGVPRCPACGSIIKPDVVLYEEPLDERTLSGAIDAISGAALLIVAGTSLSVYPAAGLIDFFHGSHLVIVNRTPTPRDRAADLCIPANIGRALDF